mmetsp:Transcript_33372/g.92135  ORF Transcript_33372/g.92135 Transcript_33372/m.92135 type:complete len:208 (+) Transcript_33372:972-1595(+)
MFWVPSMANCGCLASSCASTLCASTNRVSSSKQRVVTPSEPCSPSTWPEGRAKPAAPCGQSSSLSSSASTPLSSPPPQPGSSSPPSCLVDGSPASLSAVTSTGVSERRRVGEAALGRARSPPVAPKFEVRPPIDRRGSTLRGSRRRPGCLREMSAKIRHSSSRTQGPGGSSSVSSTSKHIRWQTPNAVATAARGNLPTAAEPTPSSV